ncbi:hypothetical protein D9M70_554270 [compost metagenome]
MAFAIGLANDGDQQIARREALAHQALALLKHEVLAVAGVVRIGPDFVPAVQFQVGDRRDLAIDRSIHLPDGGPAAFGHARSNRSLGAHIAFALVLLAEFVVADRLRCRRAGLHPWRRTCLCRNCRVC